ncbi:RNA polymerase sigma factor [Sphingomonas sp. CCH5-D11]|jgi:RNA polymerase sigma-70 factor (ECF subfamily)|uniref:RNA polymerase sigma factor n=1 Tax=Sphingomonas sp. CCH5-D11 TaxID=1768786 RepID=UPI0008369325|nr:RNA polymerase sigma factor [Sphingomonas sp. CCH5-D11]
MSVEESHISVPCADLVSDDVFGAAILDRSGPLRRYAHRLTANAVDADDLLQDTMLRCWRARASFAWGSNLTAWMRRIMRNSFLSERRRGRFVTELHPEASESVTAVIIDQERVCELDDVAKTMTTMPAEHRDILLLAAEGMSMDDVMKRLDVPEGTAKSRLSRARRQLRERLETEPSASPPAGRKSISPLPPSTCKPLRRRDWSGVMIG